jgi:transcriptional regulator with XRE-family HTH domain
MATPRRTTGQVLGERLAYYRERAGLTQAQLAERTEALGHPMNRVTVAKIEGAARERPRIADRTRADNATLTDILVLAAALDVPPVLLFVPLGRTEEVEVGNLRVHPHVLVDWFGGDAPLATAPRGKVVSRLDRWADNAGTVQMFRHLRTLQDRAQRSAADVDHLERHGTDDEAARGRVVFDRRLADLDRHLATMASAGIDSLPAMPSAWVARMSELRLAEEVQS